MIYFPFDNESEMVQDRNVSSDVFADYMASFFTNGVYPTLASNLQVVQSTGMKVKVKAGRAIINGRFAKEDLDRDLSIQASENQDRIDRIVVRLNKAERTIDLYVLKGTPSVSPQAPKLTRDGDIYELGLADVFVAKQTINIPQDRITDTRMNTSLCGLCSFTGSKVDTQNIFNQFQSALDNYLELVQSAVNQTTAGNLQSQISNLDGKKADKTQLGDQVTCEFDEPSATLNIIPKVIL